MNAKQPESPSQDVRIDRPATPPPPKRCPGESSHSEATTFDPTAWCIIHKHQHWEWLALSSNNKTEESARDAAAYLRKRGAHVFGILSAGQLVAAVQLVCDPGQVKLGDVIRRMPQTADGVPIVIGDTVYIRNPEPEHFDMSGDVIELTVEAISSGVSFSEYKGTCTVLAGSVEFGNLDCYHSQHNVPVED